MTTDALAYDTLADIYFQRRLREARRATDLPASAQFDLARSPVDNQTLQRATESFGASNDNRWGFSDVLHDLLSSNPNAVPVPDIAQLQTNLQTQGYLPPDHPANGVWDAASYGAFRQFDRDNREQQLAGQHALSSPIEAGFRILNDTLPSKVYQGIIGAAKGIVQQTGETVSRGGLAGGAIEGAAIGGAAGSVIPGVGTAIGAGVGAVIGGVGGLLGSLFGRHESIVDSLSPIDDYAKEGPHAAFEDLGFVLSAASMIRGGALAVQGAAEGIQAAGAARATLGAEATPLRVAFQRATVETPGIGSRIVGRAVGVVSKPASEAMIDWVKSNGLLAWQQAPLLRGLSGVYTGLSAGQLGARLAAGLGSGDSETTIEAAIRTAPELPHYADWASLVLWPKQFFPIGLKNVGNAARALTGDRAWWPYVHVAQEAGADGKVLSIGDARAQVRELFGKTDVERAWTDTRLRLEYGITRKVAEEKAALGKTGLELDDENVNGVLRADLITRMRSEAALHGQSPLASDLLRYSLPDPIDTRNGPAAFAGWLMTLGDVGSGLDRMKNFLTAERLAQSTSAGVRDGSIAAIVPGGTVVKSVDRAQILRQRGEIASMEQEAKRLRGEAESLRVANPVLSAQNFAQATEVEQQAAAAKNALRDSAREAGITLPGDRIPEAVTDAPVVPQRIEPKRVKIVGDVRPAPRPVEVPESRVPAQEAPPPAAAPEFVKGDIATHVSDPHARPERVWFVGDDPNPNWKGEPRAVVRTLDGQEKFVLRDNLHAARPVEAPPGTFVIGNDLLHRWQSIEDITRKVKPPPLENGLPAEWHVPPDLKLAANRFHRYFGKDLGYSLKQITEVFRRAEELTVMAQRQGATPNLMSTALRLLGFEGAQRADAVGRFLGLRPISLAEKTAGIAEEAITAARADLGLPAPAMTPRELPPELPEPTRPPADLVPEEAITPRNPGPVDLAAYDDLPPAEKRYTQHLENGKVARPYSEGPPAEGKPGEVRGPRGFGHYSEVRTKDSWATLGSVVDVEGIPHVVDEIRGEFQPVGGSGRTVIYGHPQAGGRVRLIEPAAAKRWADPIEPLASKLIDRMTLPDPHDEHVLDFITRAKAEGKDVRKAFTEYGRLPLAGKNARPGSISLNRFERLWGVSPEQLTRAHTLVPGEGPHFVRVEVDGKEYRVMVRGAGETPNDFGQLAPDEMVDAEKIKGHAVRRWRADQADLPPAAPDIAVGPEAVQAASDADLLRAVHESGFSDIAEFRRAEELVNALKGHKAPSPELGDLRARVSQARNRVKALTGVPTGHYTIAPARPNTPTAGDLHKMAGQYTDVADKAWHAEHQARNAVGRDNLAEIAKRSKLAQEDLARFVDDLAGRRLITREQAVRAKQRRTPAIAEQLKRRAQFAARDVQVPDEVRNQFAALDYKPVATGEEVLFSSELPNLLEPVGLGDYTRRAAFFDTLGLSPVTFSDRSLFALRGGHEVNELHQALAEDGIKVSGAEARDRIYKTLRRRNSRAAWGPFVLDPEGKRRFFGVDIRDLKMDEINRAFEDIPGFTDDTARKLYGALRRGAAFGSEASLRDPIDSARMIGRAMRVTGLQGFSDFIRTAHLTPKPTSQGIRLVGGAALGAGLGALEGDSPNDIVKGALLGTAAGAGLNLAARRTYGWLPDALVKANTALRYTLSFTFDAGRYTEQNMIAMVDAELPFILRPQRYIQKRDDLTSIGLKPGVPKGATINGRQAWEEAVRYFDHLNGVSYYSSAMDVDRRLFQAGILGFRPRDFETAQAYLLAQRGWSESRVEQTVAKMGRYGIGRSAAEKSANFVFFPFSFSKKLLATMGDFLLGAPARNLLIHEGLRRYHQSSLDEKLHELVSNHLPILSQLWRVNNLAYGLSPGRFFLEGLGDDKTATGKVAQILASIFIPSGAATPLAEAAGATGDLVAHAFAPVVLAGHDVKGFADILDRYIPVVRDVRTYFNAVSESKTAITQGETPYAQFSDYSDTRRAFKNQYASLALALGYSSPDSFLGSNVGAGYRAQLDQLDNKLADKYPTGFQMAQDFTNTERLNDQLIYDIAQKAHRTPAEDEILHLAEMRETWKSLGGLIGMDSTQAMALAANQIRSRALRFGANDQFYSLYQQIFMPEFGPIARTA